VRHSRKGSASFAPPTRLLPTFVSEAAPRQDRFPNHRSPLAARRAETACQEFVWGRGKVNFGHSVAASRQFSSEGLRVLRIRNPVPCRVDCCVHPGGAGGDRTGGAGTRTCSKYYVYVELPGRAKNIDTYHVRGSSVIPQEPRLEQDGNYSDNSQEKTAKTEGEWAIKHRLWPQGPNSGSTLQPYLVCHLEVRTRDRTGPHRVKGRAVLQQLAHVDLEILPESVEVRSNCTGQGSPQCHAQVHTSTCSVCTMKATGPLTSPTILLWNVRYLCRRSRRSVDH